MRNHQLMSRLFSLLLLAAVVAAVYGLFQIGWLGQVSDYNRLVEILRQEGVWGPLTCIGVQILQVIVFLVPGEVTQVAAGYVFGAWAGFIYSWIGIMLGSVCAFGFSSLVGRSMVERILGKTRLSKVDRALETHKGKSALFVLFLIPGAPKDSICYAVGLTEFKMGEFLILSGLGRVPALLFSTMMGSHIYEQSYLSLSLTVILAVVIGGVAFFYIKKRRN